MTDATTLLSAVGEALAACADLGVDVGPLRVRLAREEVVVALVGEARAGKSTLLAALEHVGVPQGFRLLDTPGLNAGADAALPAAADAVLLVSDMQQAVSQATRAAIARIAREAPHVLLVLTKADKALANADLAPDPAAEVAEARRVAVKRFAAEVGRKPADVIAALVNSYDVGSLAAEMAPLWEVLRTERALVLAARAAALTEQAAAAAKLAATAGSAAQRDRIAALEAQRLPDPRAFRREALARVEAALPDPAAWAAAAQDFRNELARQGVRWELAFRKATSEEELREAARRAAEAAPAYVRTLADVQREGAVAALLERGAAAREAAIADLRARYAGLDAQAIAPRPFPEPAALTLPPADPLDVGLTAALTSFDTEKWQLKVGGATAGAVLGTAIAPGIGTVIGGLVGSLGSLFLNLDVLRNDLLKPLLAGLEAADKQLPEALRAGGAQLERELGAAIAADLDQALEALATRIADALAAEEAALALAHADLATREAAVARLNAAQDRLKTARQAAEAASRALARS